MALFSKERDEARAERDAAISERDAGLKLIEDLQGLAEKLTAERDAAKAELDSAKAKITTLETEKTAAESAKVAAENALKARNEEFDTALNAAVIERCASAGIDPVNHDPKASEEVKTMKRAEFEKLSFSARDAHIREGGKLID